ncbi:hypothetical protein TPHA_0N01550 [Tetrapisispora phaffii CBS 4417]|uniref:V-type proton ATPase subunit a n=1 Tax=Tetrapisispora phaffii (strain ATCC 24235 / CBS 4417 / NBRC 1672 / NRRL Y-8282 / UCD 70-5) TaxID=1071381 RepID=G8C1A8_TETPH|nr:hypothetical protein TPHA_0N01550 [Tetrapisispora phaffii CBS 4417]CCE65936.1 hypothetical protein TPHA_0N01550 [Tetrapisispora phaffii CBS 4417]
MSFTFQQEEAIFRSADMVYIQLYIPLEISREVVSLLGNLGNVMFRDLNSDVSTFQRNYIGQLRKFDDAERLLTYMSDVSMQHSVAMWNYTLHVDQEGESITPKPLAQVIDSLNINSINEVNEIIDDVIGFESRLKQLNDSLLGLKENLATLIEKRQVVFQCGRFLEFNQGLPGRLSRERRDTSGGLLSLDNVSETLSDAFSFDLDENNFNYNNSDSNNNDNVNIDTLDDLEQGAPEENGDYAEFHFFQNGFHNQFIVVGALEANKIEVLNRILWRLTRGNLFFQNFPIENSNINANVPGEPDEKGEKHCFIVFTHGETLLKKINRVIESLNGKIYSMENFRSHSKIQELNDQIDELTQIVTATEQSLHTELLVINDQLPIWSALIKREKYIYATLNLFRPESHALLAEGWIPSNETDSVSNALKEHSESIGSEYTPVINIIKTNKSPPTYHRTNKFTGAFQSIVDAYGIASYQEVNPGLATIVTFPFMFAIMFGDLGHGFILFLISLYLIFNETKFDKMQRDEIFDMAYTGRYVICLMGAFSIYTGLMYNDIFSKPLTLFKSGWEWPSNFKKGELIEASKIGVYRFGIDYNWHGADNSLLFTNSYKMKLSILMGFIHMTYSYMFSYVNYKYKNSRVDIIGNFIPGLIFMQSIFGYLSITIVYKWTKDWIKDGKPAPGLLNMLINMFLAPGKVEEHLYSGQAFVQTVLLLAALVCVPWLLLYKPLTLKKQHAMATSQGYQNVQQQRYNESLMETQSTFEEDEVIITDSNEEDHSDFNFGDIMIHQVIHTIEFCLNCISHTASYLRLWALSLAHAQLSSVLWDMTIANAFTASNPGSILSVARVVFLFGMWFILTVCILVMMEGTSAMLHSLRLHWVEAMSKFFEGEGYAYEPFSFKRLSEQ